MRTVPHMNDNNMSNTPDNASRPGNTPRKRDSNGRFIKRNKENGQPKSMTEMAIEVVAGSVEEAENWPLAGSNGDITVGEFFALRDEIVGDPLEAIKASVENALGDRPNVTVEVREYKPTRIGQHVDVEKKITKGHTRRAKVKRTGQAPVADNRRTMLYQVRTLPGNRGYGLFYADGIPLKNAIAGAHEKGLVLQHWLGENWYQAIDPGAARVFITPDDARKFRREHFSVTVDDEGTKERREARYEHRKQLRRMGATTRHPSRTTKNKTERKPRKVREDLTKLYSILLAEPKK